MSHIPPKGAPQRCRKQRLELVGQRIREALREARQSQIDDQEPRDLVDRELTAIMKEKP